MNVFEKILEEIEKKIETAEKVIVKPPADKLDEIANDTAEAFLEAYQECVDIVRKHAERANEGSGWIPVSERLPEVPDRTEDFYCPEFNVMIKGAEKATTLKCAPDGTWFDDLGEVYVVTAWQPLPEPYKGV